MDDPWWWFQKSDSSGPYAQSASSYLPTPSETDSNKSFRSFYQYRLSRELLDEPVQVTVEGLEFLSLASLPFCEQQLVVSVQLALGDALLTSKINTVSATSFENRRPRWSEHLVLPFKICDLSLDARLVFSIFGPPQHPATSPTLLGQATFKLFSSSGVLRVGKQEIFVLAKSGIQNVLFDCPLHREDEVLFEREETTRRSIDRDTSSLSWLNKMSEVRLLTLRRNRRLQHQSFSPKYLGILAIELVDYHHPVMWELACDCEELNPAPSSTSLSQLSPNSLTPLAKPRNFFPEIPGVLDMPNVVEEKFYQMRRSVTRKSGEDPTIRPNVRDLAQIDRILSNHTFGSKVRVEDEDLLWKFRYSLVHNPRALTRVLSSVRWDSMEEIEQVELLLNRWEETDFADVLQLLSGKITEHEVVRNFAVRVLAKSRNEVLCLYLPQLVQALRNDQAQSLQTFLVQRCGNDVSLAAHLHWFLKVEMLLEQQQKHGGGGSPFKSCWEAFELAKIPSVAASIAVQDRFVTEFITVARTIVWCVQNKNSSQLQQLISRLEKYSFSTPTSLAGFPQEQIVGVKKGSIKVLTSATSPTVVDFFFKEDEREPGTIRVMFKVGDDMRQDQLVLQLIELMDGLFKKSGLDLEMTVYRVLSTGPLEGVIEFVPDAIPLTRVSKEFGSIRKFLHHRHPHAESFSLALGRFIRSCAGYAVVTYILGIGDRHLDNILITPSGKMFHIDFGYCFGRDKRLATPVRITSDMMETMGKEGEVKFRRYCWEAFKALRAQAALILSVVGLMGEASLPDLLQTSRVLAGIQERLKLHLSEEDAEKSLHEIFTQSVFALGPIIYDRLHAIAQG